MNRDAILKQIQDGTMSPKEGLKNLEMIMNTGFLDHSSIYFTQEYCLDEERLEENQCEGDIILIGNCQTIQAQIRQQCEKRVISVSFGDTYHSLAQDEYEIDRSKLDDYKKVFRQVVESGAKPTSIMFYLDTEWQEKKVGAGLQELYAVLLYMTQSLMQLELKHDILLTVAYSNEKEIVPMYEAISGFLRTLVLENSKFAAKMVYLKEVKSISASLYREGIQYAERYAQVRYEHDKRYVKKQKEIPYKEGTYTFQEHQVYIITGGAGALGLLFAKYLVEQGKCQVILLGRRKKESKIEAAIKGLQLPEDRVVYMSCDITDEVAVNETIKAIKKKYCHINGLLHCAGVIHDNYIVKKKIEEAQEVIAVKAKGVINLSKALEGETLDFVMYFSSIASNMGNLGQSDYAYANGFMDACAEAKMGIQAKKSITMNWPFWNDGGMETTTERLHDMMDKWGIVPLSKTIGEETFSMVLSSEYSNVTVLEGNVDKIRESVHKLYLLPKKRKSIQKDEFETLYQVAENLLKTLLSEETKIPVEKIDSSMELEEYGIDSIMIVSLNKRLDKQFENLSKTLFYEYKDIASLATYFAEHYGEQLMEQADHHEVEAQDNDFEEVEDAKTSEWMDIEERFLSQSKFDSEYEFDSGFETQHKKEEFSDDIAIIGVDGIYPKANDLEQFWTNLMNGVDCVTEIPEDRWDWREHFDPDKKKSGITYCKWGGFLDQVDKFDPIFFKISPKEACTTDPQERLFLEVAWNTIEGAGYTRKRLKNSTVGVFVGVMYGHYQMYGAEESLKDNVMALNSSFSSIANRVSYFMDFNGPCIALDTMCSSSLTSIHLACESIKRGECDIALAGGVNLSLHQNKYIMLSQGKFASSEGKCRSFGEGGDGYVPGEGVGAVLLKPLSQAKREKDIIYGVIKASSINHGGKTNGYSVPNPNAQCDLIKKTLEKAHLNPDSMNYIEAHGTGTPLGDPIEITGLTKAFREYTQKKQYCAIGSVKANIGHLESAAGIAAVTKVLLQFQHKKLVPSILSDTLNTNIHFEETPFYVQRTLKDWEPVTYEKNGVTYSYPRRSGISAFGAGGSNAHIILEEYIDTEQEIREKGKKIFLLSARDEERLDEYVSKYIQWLKRVPIGEKELLTCLQEHKNVLCEIFEEILGIPKNELDVEADIFELGIQMLMLEQLERMLNERFECHITIDIFTNCNTIQKLAEYINEHSQGTDSTFFNNLIYTLQYGREEMEQRLAFVVGSVEELLEYLEAYLKRSKEKRYYTGNILEANGSNPSSEGSVGSSTLDQKAQAWVRGEKQDWANEKNGRMIRIPTYPFAKDSYWFEASSQPIKTLVQGIHPLLDKNISTFEQESFQKVFSLNDPVIGEHIVKGKNILPGAAYLEIARVAGMQATNHAVSVIKNVTWNYPFEIEKQEKALLVELETDGTEIRYQIRAEDTSLCSTGEMRIGAIGDFEYMDLDQIRKNANHRIEKKEIYDRLETLGFYYGPAFQVTNCIYEGEREALAELEIQDDNEQYGLNPFLLDSAFRAIGGISYGKSDELKIPFALEQIEIYERIPKKSYALAQIVSEQTDNSKYDIFIMNEEGKVLVKVKKFMARAFKKKEDVYYYEPVWNTLEPTNGLQINTIKQMLIFAREDQLEYYQEICYSVGIDVIFVLPNAVGGKREAQVYYVNNEDESYCQLFKSLKEDGVDPAVILHVWNLGEDSAQLELSVLSVKKIFKAIEEQFRSSKVKCYYAGMKMQKNGSEAITGISKSLVMLNHNFELVYFSFEESTKDTARILISEIIDGRLKNGAEVRYVNDSCLVKKIEKTTIPSRHSAVLKENGTYLITGGAGGIGRLLSKSIAQKVNANLILIGKSSLDAKRSALIQELNQLGSRAIYLSCDISQQEEVQKAISTVKEKGWKIDGVFHCAGIDSTKSILESSDQEFEKILQPKLYGTQVLDQVLENEPLEYVVLFSSISSVVGDFGVGSYAAANAYMDYYALYRNQLVEQGLRKGRTISINWSLWKEGGMSLSEEDTSVTSVFSNYSGMVPLATEEALEALFHVMASGKEQVIVVSGEEQKIDKVLKIGRGEAGLKKEILNQQTMETAPSNTLDLNSSTDTSSDTNSDISSDSTDQLKAKTMQYLKEVLAKVIHFPAEKIHTKVAFEQYGVDSVLIMDLNRELEKNFSNLPNTIFFEYTNIEELSAYLLEKYESDLRKYLQVGDTKQDKKQDKNQDKNQDKKQQKIQNVEATKAEIRKTPEIRSRFHKPIEAKTERDDIAIIGMDGRFPMAENLEEYWDNLINGRDCITLIPAERWDYNEYYDEDRNASGKTYSKWGGFIPNVDKFDPLFFHISPMEAEFMDPQERIFLEMAWNAFEDAGYAKRDLANQNVGVFVGAMYGHYQLISAEYSKQNKESLIAGSIFSTIPNRISYYMGLNGPSVAIDSACSSGLEAIRQGCQNIQDGTCDMVLAGGINLSIHPNKYLYLSQAGFLSSDGTCKSFGAGGDGYVPGEGAGAVVLKRLSDAKRDGDHIYGIIKGMSVRHTGITNGYGTPSLKAQTELVKDVFKRANIVPETVSYVESAALGIEMGDKIEIDALSRVFEAGDCAIGSVKSNIGHSEAASGMAGLLKVLLQMKYRTIVPSIHSEVLNPLIPFDELPFHVQHTVEEWKEGETPRRALINSFGAGGTYLNMLVEEYNDSRVSEELSVPYIFVLSARTKDSLRIYVEKMLTFIQNYKGEIEMERFLSTLQTGREVMEERMAFVVQNQEELVQKLTSYLGGDLTDILVSQNTSNMEAFVSGFAGDEFIKTIFEQKDYQKIALLWVSGVEISWKDYYQAIPTKMSLPVYPFDKTRCWIGQAYDMQDEKEDETDEVGQERDIEKELKEMLSKFLKVPENQIKSEAKLTTYGFDSLTGMKLANRLKETYGEQISLKEVFACKTLGELVVYIETMVQSIEPIEEQVLDEDVDIEFYSALIDELTQK